MDQGNRNIAWRVVWWRGNQFGANAPKQDALVPVERLVDALYKEQKARRQIRVSATDIETSTWC